MAFSNRLLIPILALWVAGPAHGQTVRRPESRLCARGMTEAAGESSLTCVARQEDASLETRPGPARLRTPAAAPPRRPWQSVPKSPRRPPLKLPRFPVTQGLRLVPADPKAARLRAFILSSYTSRLVIGWEFDPRRLPRLGGERINLTASWLAVEEKRRRPALLVGTGGDRLGTPLGQSFYFTASKTLPSVWRIAAFPHAGASFDTSDKRLRPIAGLDLDIGTRFGSRIIFDGVHVHPSASARFGRHSFSLLLVRARTPGYSYGLTF